MSSSFEDLKGKFQRDINRIADADRNTRKRGLQKLLEDLPWNESSHRDALIRVALEVLFQPLLAAVADPVEKCRELALMLLSKVLALARDILDFSSALVTSLSQRINDNPFPETSEELRLQIAVVLDQVMRHPSLLSLFPHSRNEATIQFPFPDLLAALPKALVDPFPSAKKQLADLIVSIAKYSRNGGVHFSTPIFKCLAANAVHQQHKVRSSSLKAYAAALSCNCLSSEYESNTREILLPLSTKLVADRSASTRRELAALVGSILVARIENAVIIHVESSLVSCDVDLLVYLLLLAGDEAEDVAAGAIEVHLCLLSITNHSLQQVSISWFRSGSDSDTQTSNADGQKFVGDAEIALREAESMTSSDVEPVHTSLTSSSSSFAEVDAGLVVKSFLGPISEKIIAGIGEWVTESRCRYVNSLSVLMSLCKDSLTASSLLPSLLSCLGPPLRDDEKSVRAAAEKCCQLLGRFFPAADVLPLLLPQLQGQLAGGDTWSQRCLAARLISAVLPGFVHSGISITPPAAGLLLNLARALAEAELYDHREGELREALLLLVRSILNCFPDEVAAEQQLQRYLSTSLVFLQTRCPAESPVVGEFSTVETKRLSIIMSQNPDSEAFDSMMCISRYFNEILDTICPPDKRAIISWEPNSPRKSAFEVLLRSSPREAWVNHEKVLPIIYQQVQPEPMKPLDAIGEYLATTGQEVIPDSPEVSSRLSLLALMESLLRSGSSDWECGKYIGAASVNIARRCVLPNLVWRVGRVEATVRKVALAVCFGLLKAGGTITQSLFDITGELLPLLCSNLDDHETSPRLMACMSITVVLERLKGSFGDQVLSEMYPNLLKRLDDSSDQVRIAICSTLVSFFSCANKSCYSSTLLEYSLDQLFVHLDDKDPAIQNAVLPVLVAVADIKKDLVLKKAENCRHSHRNVSMINKLLAEVEGFEILS